MMMIRVSRRTPPADDAAKAKAIVAAGGSTMFCGDPKHLRAIQRLLGDDLKTFLGDIDGDAVLTVSSPEPIGSLHMDRVPQD